MRRGRRVGLGLLVLAVVVSVQYLRPIPAIAGKLAVASSTRTAGSPPSLPWPKVGGGALGAEGLGPVAESPGVRPAPMASVTKVMTSLVVLEDKPLELRQSGPVLTVDSIAAADYEVRHAAGESVVAVEVGEQLTEYQALQAMLIPSGNNIAKVVANWDAGSADEMVRRMTKKATEWGMRATTFADVAGISPSTVSTPADLVRLADHAMRNPVLAQIVSQPEADLPVAGRVYNVDSALGKNGIIGIKTGNIPEGGACFMFAARQMIDGRPLILLGAVMGLTTLDDAFAASRALIVAGRPGLGIRRVASRDQAVGAYRAPWGSRADLLATSDLDLVTWPGLVQRVSLEVPPVTEGLPPGWRAGAIRARLGDQDQRVQLVTATALAEPTLGWHFIRTDPFLY